MPALKGRAYATQYEKMTEQPIPSLILELGLPTTISMLVTNLYNIVDTWFVGRIGTSASGAIGVVFGLMAILQAVGFMFGMGSGSNISRLLGAHHIRRARQFSATAFYAALLSGTVVSIVGLSCLAPLCRLLGSTDTILPYARTYATFILLAAPAMVTSCVMNNILRYEGHASFAMVGLVSGGIINIFGDALFMMGFGMGIAGAGFATMLSQYISAGILLSMFLRKKTQTNFSTRYLPFFTPPMVTALPDGDLPAAANDLDVNPGCSLFFSTLWSILLVGFPSLIRQGLGSISTMVLNDRAGVYGDAAIAAMSIVARVCNFLFCVGLGIGQGFQPVSGFNYGAKRYSRVKKGFFFTLGFGTILLAFFSALGWIFAAPVASLLRNDPEVVTIAVPAMRAQCAALLLMPLTLCGNMLFQSIGLSGRAALLSSLRSGACFIPLILILAPLWGLPGVMYAQPLSDVLSALIAIPFLAHFFHHFPADGAPETAEHRSIKEISA